MSIVIDTPPKEHEYKKVAALPSRNDFQGSDNHSLEDVKTFHSVKRKSESFSQNPKDRFVKMKKHRSADFQTPPGSKPHRKRGNRSDRYKHNSSGRGPLPRHFLLGGNITDPLNLNSMNDDKINMLANAETPVSSPIPTPSYRKQVEVKIPMNYSDPLNLNCGDDADPIILTPTKSSAKRRKKHKRKRVSGSTDPSAKGDTIKETTEDSTNYATPLTVKTDDGKRSPTTNVRKKIKRLVDKIVSPAVPQHSPKAKRKRTISEGSRTGEAQSDAKVRRREENLKFKKQTSNPAVKSPVKKQKTRNNDDRFIYGNYNRYYGKRNPEEERDKRLDSFKKKWFEEKTVLDIGCNIGHITLSIAKNFGPHMITGMDIDGKLINIARKNIKHYASPQLLAGKKVPVSLPVNYGAIAATALPEPNKKPAFPGNVHFVQGNYVLERDELVELQREEYDVIMALSVTKWIQLNFGDAGLKRFFRRIYRQLKPGGLLILEPQSYASYKKKKKLTEVIFENFQAIRLMPEMFSRYLLSNVGFASCERIQTPYNKSRGFQRPMFVFRKPLHPPMRVGSGAGGDAESCGVTPLMNIDCLPNFTPSCETMSTPGYDSYNFYLEYGRTPNRQCTPLWEEARSTHTTTACTPPCAVVTGSVSTTPVDSPKVVPEYQMSPLTAQCSPHIAQASAQQSGHVPPGSELKRDSQQLGHVSPSSDLKQASAQQSGHVSPTTDSQSPVHQHNALSDDVTSQDRYDDSTEPPDTIHEGDGMESISRPASPVSSQSSGSTCDTCSSSDNSTTSCVEDTKHPDHGGDTQNETVWGNVIAQNENPLFGVKHTLNDGGTYFNDICTRDSSNDVSAHEENICKNVSAHEENTSYNDVSVREENTGNDDSVHKENACNEVSVHKENTCNDDSVHKENTCRDVSS